MKKNIEKSSQERTNAKNNNALSTSVENLQETLKDAIVLIQELSDKVCNLEMKVEVLNTILDVRKDGLPYERNAPLVSRRLNAMDEKLCCAAKNYEFALKESRKNEIRAKAAARLNYLMEHPHSAGGTYEDYKEELEKVHHKLNWGC